MLAEKASAEVAWTKMQRSIRHSQTMRTTNMSSARSCLPSGKGNACRFGTASPFRCTQLRPLGTPTRQHRRRIPLQSIQRVQATAVSTSNDYSLGNSLSENSFEVKGDIEKVFQYAADFSHIDRWDSGTAHNPAALTCVGFVSSYMLKEALRFRYN